MEDHIWQACLALLKTKISAQSFELWIKPLQSHQPEKGILRLLAPNELLIRELTKNYLDLIQSSLHEISPDQDIRLELGVGSTREFVSVALDVEAANNTKSKTSARRQKRQEAVTHTTHPLEQNNLNPDFSFVNMVEGKSNQFALAACSQIPLNPGKAHNPLFIYGNTGLGKTHLLHAVGNAITARYPDARLLYQTCDNFIQDIVRAVRNNTVNEIRHFYKSLNALLIDDIQMLSTTELSQDIFMYTFNSLLDGGHQVILTCDRYPKELDGMEDRLKSRFGSGLIVCIEPPEFEHRIAILLKKADLWGIELPEDAAFFIAQTVRSSVRELEGSLKQVIAMANFKGVIPNLSIAKEALANLTMLQNRLITIDNIQRVVADYYRLKITDLLSANRQRSVARPRQLAMYLTKQLTQHSLPEIGRSFGKKDHTTVIHACRKIEETLAEDSHLQRDYQSLYASLMG